MNAFEYVLAIIIKPWRRPVSASRLGPDPSGPEGDTRHCPLCAEMIKHAAVKCRYCGSDVSRLSGTATGAFMQDNKTVALVGAALLFVGAFVPIISVPIVGSLNYFQNGRGDGVIIVLIAAATAVFAMAGRTRDVLWTGLAALLMLAFTFVRFQSKLSEMRATMESDLADNPFRGLAEAAMGSIQMQWGWAVLLLGAGITTYAGWQARRKSNPSNPMKE